MRSETEHLTEFGRAARSTLSVPVAAPGTDRPAESHAVDVPPAQRPGAPRARGLSGLLPVVVLTAIILAGAIIRALDLGGSSLWLDEAAIWQIGLGSVRDVIDANARINSAPPLFPLLVKVVGEVWGNSEAQLRSVSLVGGILSLVALAALSRQWLSWTGTLVAVALAAAAPVQVYYSRELREYSIGVLLACVLLLTANRLVRTPSSRSRVLLYTAAGAACMAMQLGLWILIAVTHGVYCVSTVRSRSRVQALWFAASTAFFAAVAAGVYWVSLRGRVAADQLSFSYLDYYYLTDRAPIGLLHDIVDRTRTLLVYTIFGGPVAMSISIGLLTCGVIALLTRKGPYRLAPLYALAPMAILIVLALFSYYPFGGVHQDLFLTPMIYILFAAGFEFIVQLRYPLLGRSLGTYARVLLCIALPILALVGWKSRPSEYWPREGENLRPVLQTMADRIQTGDSIYVYPLAGPAFRYYWDGRSIGANHPDTTVVWEDLTVDPSRDVSEITSMLGTSHRVWVVLSHSGGDQRTIVPYLESRYAELDRITPGWGELHDDSFVDPAAYLFAQRS